MPPLRDVRRSRRLSRMSPMDGADYDWQDAAAPQLYHSPPIHPLPPSPSTCTTTSSDSPSPPLTHLPFAPGSSHTRNRKEGHIPRPPNAFMVFRSWLWNKDNLKSVERDNRNVSRIAGRYWNELSEAERVPFRKMAEEVKARHAELYPEYKYSPMSRKRGKVPQRRSHRSDLDETEKCKKVADLLLGGVAGSDLAKYLEDVQEDPERKEEVAEAPMPVKASAPAAARKLAKKAKASRKKLTSRRPGPSEKPWTVVPPPSLSIHPSESPDSASAPPPTTEAEPEIAETPGLFIGTPGLMYPPGDMGAFVANEDIPHLSLYDCDEVIIEKEEADEGLPVLPSHLLPGAHSPFSGVKPEAIEFVDTCILGAYLADARAPASPPCHSNDESYYTCFSQGAFPFGCSPVVFSNPFETSDFSTERPALLSALDQLFGQIVSPLSLSPSLTGNW
ncbi:hypothetical protein PAXRUDRAFT_414321 [Paxillus rubicundulus Ve08.2h10]|uniref:HMG box domain-containing protein n=1 Tax=Paxillus rubicundulus Ve08.2h10 TaxID=930991 RepID=A0A0D0E5H2_9AGAM|nr:hypothetical protein PAXRUDRAFT_414321 [Paxillus rubicundulus Ve08.2h10]